MPNYENFLIVPSPRVVETYCPSGGGFPFETSFACGPVKTFVPETDQIDFVKASIDSLKPFVDSSIDLQKNYDMLGVAFNAFVVNVANKNGQVISTDVALSCVENFKFKPMNIEHKRANVVGLITSYGFSEYGSDKPLQLKDVARTSKPFNVVLSGFVWRVVNEEFADNLEESSDPNSSNYLNISASWEMGFREFNVARGSKLLSEAEIISSKSEVDEIKSKLIHFGGTGTDEGGKPLFINLIGEVLPLGIGFTENPAADVRGVQIASTEEDEEKDEQNEADSKVCNTNSESCNSPEPIKIDLNIDSQSSQSVDLNVLTKKESCGEDIAGSNLNKKINIKENNTMLIRSINDLNDDSLKQLCATDIRALFEQEIKNASEEYSKQQTEKEQVVAELESAKQGLEAKVAELLFNFEQAQSEMSELKLQIEAREKAELFQNRMSSIDEDFNLNDEEREVIGEQIKDMDEEAFEKWFKAFNVFAKKSSKATQIEEKVGAAETSESKIEKEIVADNVSASDCKSEEKEEEAIKLLESAEAEEVEVPNSSSQQDTIREKFAKAFNSQTIKIDLTK
jgi:hypothetical protein